MITRNTSETVTLLLRFIMELSTSKRQYHERKGEEALLDVLQRTVDIICILLEISFAIISLPFKLVKAIFDIANILMREPS